MQSTFHISRTPELVLGCGQISKLYEMLLPFTGSALIVTGGSAWKAMAFFHGFIEKLESEGRFAGHIKIAREPSPKDVDDAVREYRQEGIGCVVSIGGGSVIDAGKAISAMLRLKGSIVDYLEGIGTRLPTGLKVPFIAVPTTAGTGSEATWNAVITQEGDNGFKKSLRHTNYVPDIALLDPELTATCPPEITAASGMDAFTQLVESYLSTRANPFTDALGLDAIERIYRSIEKAFVEGRNLEARFEMTYAAYISGINLANGGLGVVHGFAQPLGSLFGIPHGTVCGTLMAAVNRVTARKLVDQDMRDSTTFHKYAKMGKLFAGTNTRSESYYLNFCIDEIERLTSELQLPNLSVYGVTEKDFETIIARTGLKYHPVNLNEEDLKEILKQRL